MIKHIQKRQYSRCVQVMVFCVLSVFLTLTVLPPNAYARNISTVTGLPLPGNMLHPSSAFTPPLIKGITIHPDDPFLFDFIVHPGDENLQGEELKKESSKLIKYFMAALTIPEDELWVNLSPHEKDRIIPEGFGQTEMGRDLWCMNMARRYLWLKVI